MLKKCCCLFTFIVTLYGCGKNDKTVSNIADATFLNSVYKITYAYDCTAKGIIASIADCQITSDVNADSLKSVLTLLNGSKIPEFKEVRHQLAYLKAIYINKNNSSCYYMLKTTQKPTIPDCKTVSF